MPLRGPAHWAPIGRSWLKRMDVNETPPAGKPKFLPHDTWDPVKRMVRAIVVFVCHGGATAVALGVMRVLELFLTWLWPESGGTTGPLVWEGLPLERLVRSIDVGLIVVVGGFGLFEAFEAYRREL